MVVDRTKMAMRSLALGFTPCVLAIDDDEMNLMLIEQILGDKYKVIKVADGPSALAYLADHTADIVLLDYMMPGMNGMEVLALLRANPATEQLPIIMLTGDMAAERLAATLRLFDELVFALAKAVDVKDAYTRGHSERVAQYSREMARRAGDTGERLDSIYSVGLLHDIGKIGIPVTIINKTTRLTDEEYAVIKAHTTMGADILDMVKEFPELSVGARSHHERWDGKGYPDGLAGKAIPRMARIISVADAYDAMTSRRSYRNALPQDESMSDRELFDHLNWYVEGVEMR